MSDDTTTPETTTATAVSAVDAAGDDPPATMDSLSKSQLAIQSLSSILPSIPPTLFSSPNPPHSLLHDPDVSAEISSLLRHHSSGTGDNNLCRWLYDAFQSGDPGLQLVVLRFIPVITGTYLSRATLRRPLAGFEAILLALYAHETSSRAGQPVTVNVPDLSHPSLYHESTTPGKYNATSLNLAVVSPSLEPHGTVRSTRRAWIVGVALELYYNKISEMPASSKIEFCEFCGVWAGDHHDQDDDEPDGPSGLGVGNGGESGPSQLGERRSIPLPWELLQPILRILGHCVVSCARNKEVYDAAKAACRSLHGRAMHDINPKAILATESLLRLRNMNSKPNDNADDDNDNDNDNQQLDSSTDDHDEISISSANTLD
ncbi:Hyccin [Trema orientale]|uniref:Hyccin n=1 Tax=Trema orientale TaxID=63057 RepID=A0A2P5FL99_TREOI|nr:Hyccin [Trema orientale]